MVKERYTAVLEREDNMYVALCPELDVASQGATIEEACENLKEAIELFLEHADETEIKQRLQRELIITQVEVDRAA